MAEFNSSHTGAAIDAGISALPAVQAETTENWVLLNDLDNRVRALETVTPAPATSEASEFDLTLTTVTGLTVVLRIYNVVKGNTVSTDWGDGTSENATTTTAGIKTFTHTYAGIGNYTVSVDSTGAYFPYGSSIAANVFNEAINYTCTAVRLGVRCTEISDYALNGLRSMTSIAIPSSVTSIAKYGLASALSLRSVVIPSSVTSIGATAFDSGYSIVKYTMLGSTPPTLASTSTFNGINSICIIEVPAGSLGAYQTETNWVAFADYVREAET